MTTTSLVAKPLLVVSCKMSCILDGELKWELPSLTAGLAYKNKICRLPRPIIIEDAVEEEKEEISSRASVYLPSRSRNSSLYLLSTYLSVSCDELFVSSAIWEHPLDTILAWQGIFVHRHSLICVLLEWNKLPIDFPCVHPLGWWLSALCIVCWCCCWFRLGRSTREGGGKIE